MSLVRPSKNVFLQVLWNGVDTSIPSLYLFTDTKRYVFNCGEGLQRLFTQRKIKLGKLDTFFLTRHQWSHLGGIPGFGMTLRDMKNDAPFKARIKTGIETQMPSIEPTMLGAELGEANIESAELKLESAKLIETFTSNTESAKLIETLTSNTESASSAIDKLKSLIENKEMSISSSKEGVDETGKEAVDSSVRRKVNIYAPQGITKIIDSAKSFLHFDNTDVDFSLNEHLLNDQNEFKEYKDDEFTLYSTLICKKSENVKQTNCIGDDTINPVDISPLTDPPSLCYACHLKPLPGKFNVQSARKLGIPHGPLYGMLQQGETIVLDDGRSISPQQVLGPSVPGPRFLIIDCPSVYYIESLIENSHLNKYLLKEDGAHLVVHLSGEEVCQNKEYSEWVKRFPTVTKHVFLNNVLQKCVALKSQHSLQIMLNHIHSRMFPLTAEHEATGEQESTSDSNVAVNFMKINLRELVGRPSKVFDYKEVKSEIDHSELLCRVRNALKKQEEISIHKPKDVAMDKQEDLLKKEMADSVNGDTLNISGKRCYNEDLNLNSNKKVHRDRDYDVSNSKYLSQEYPKVIFLGTGASLPSKYRNVSGTLVLLNENDAVLLDCGEGTYGELFRHYGDNVSQILMKVKLIFISHMHADHHLGLITLISILNKLQNQSYVVMAPSLLYGWLTKYAEISESLKFKFVSCRDSYGGISVHENIHVEAVKVNHPGIAHGVVLECNNGLKITYSGDTMPCDSLINMGANSTLLIHEATLEDDMIEDARERKHSTTSQAIDVAQKMNAEFVLLTHFSQRYPKVPVLKNEMLKGCTAYAFDHMEVTLGDIPKFCELIPTLTALYTEEKEEKEE